MVKLWQVTADFGDRAIGALGIIARDHREAKADTAINSPPTATTLGLIAIACVLSVWSQAEPWLSATYLARASDAVGRLAGGRRPRRTMLSDASRWPAPRPVSAPRGLVLLPPQRGDRPAGQASVSARAANCLAAGRSRMASKATIRSASSPSGRRSVHTSPAGRTTLTRHQALTMPLTIVRPAWPS